MLIIDDHPANRLLISRQLTLLGHSFREANNGEEGGAVAAAEAGRDHYRLQYAGNERSGHDAQHPPGR